MTRDQLLAEFRVVVDDQSGPPYAWSDERALFWLSEGQDVFCEKTGFWTDASTYKLVTEEGVTEYPFPDRVIEIKEAWVGSRRLAKFIQGDRPQAQGAGNILAPDLWQADKETGVFVIYNPPIGGVQIDLRVWRYAKKALNHMAAGAYDAQPEIPTRFHLAMVEYAAAKAFGDHDRERQDPVKAKDHKGAFNDYCYEGEVAFERLNAAPVRVEPSSLYVV